MFLFRNDSFRIHISKKFEPTLEIRVQKYKWWYAHFFVMFFCIIIEWWDSWEGKNRGSNASRTSHLLFLICLNTLTFASASIIFVLGTKERGVEMAFEMFHKVSFTPFVSSIIEQRCSSSELQEFLEVWEGSSYLDCNRRIQPSRLKLLGPKNG